MSDSEARFNRHLQRQENEHLDAMYARRSAGETTMSEPLTEAEIAEIEEWHGTEEDVLLRRKDEAYAHLAVWTRRAIATIRSLQAENNEQIELLFAARILLDLADTGRPKFQSEVESAIDAALAAHAETT